MLISYKNAYSLITETWIHVQIPAGDKNKVGTNVWFSGFTEVWSTYQLEYS